MIRAVNASLEPESVAEALVSRVSSWIPAPGWLVIADDGGGQTRQMAADGLEPPFESAAHAVAAWVMRSGAVYSTGDIATDRRVSDNASAAAVGFPLLCRGNIIGALVAIDRTPEQDRAAFRRIHVGAAAGEHRAGAIALENALRVQRAEALSVTDDLTQLYNSRYLSQVLRRETKRASRSGRPLSLLFVDLDGFKSINDTHGHLFGSRALVEAASVIRAQRPRDRHGGSVRRRRIRVDSAGHGQRRSSARRRSRARSHRRIQFPPQRWVEHPTDGLGRRGDAARRRRHGRWAHPGR
jgi:GAF domain-containing protein